MAQYMPPVELGEVMRGGTLGVVEASGDNYAVGDVVQGMWGWRSHALQPAMAVNKLPAQPGVPWDAYMSVLGATGMTACWPHGPWRAELKRSSCPLPLAPWALSWGRSARSWAAG